jgi:hypothetical protein
LTLHPSLRRAFVSVVPFEDVVIQKLTLGSTQMIIA